MRVDLHDLPRDITLLHGLVRDLVGEIESKQTRLSEAEAETEAETDTDSEIKAA